MVWHIHGRGPYRRTYWSDVVSLCMGRIPFRFVQNINGVPHMHGIINGFGMWCLWMCGSLLNVQSLWEYARQRGWSAISLCFCVNGTFYFHGYDPSSTYISKCINHGEMNCCIDWHGLHDPTLFITAKWRPHLTWIFIWLHHCTELPYSLRPTAILLCKQWRILYISLCFLMRSHPYALR